MKLAIEGEAVSRWTESSGSNKSQTTFVGDEKHLEKRFYIFGKKESETSIEKGTHIYDFEFQLPSNLPYTIEGKYGHVRYFVKATLDLPWAFDLQSEIAVLIVRNDHVNALIDCNLPVEVEEMKTFCCWCCKSGPLTLKVNLPKQGYQIGEEIPVSVQVRNQSAKRIDETSIELLKVHRFFSHDPFKKVKEQRESIVEFVVKDETFITNLEIPDTLTISNEKFCNVYQVCYEIKITALVNGFSDSPEVIVPVTIGGKNNYY